MHGAEAAVNNSTISSQTHWSGSKRAQSGHTHTEN